MMGGNLVVMESPAEWACVQHWLNEEFTPESQEFAIGLRADFNDVGIYKWQYFDGSTAIPEYFVWAEYHPRDEPCVSMEVGTEVVTQGAWLDGDCIEKQMYAVCEREKM